MSSFPLSRRTFLAGTGAGLTLAAGRFSPARAQAGSATLQLSWTPSVQFGGSYLALDRGYWSDEGLEVALSAGGPNVAVEPQVVSGNALIGVSAADYASAAVEQGARFKILGVGMQKNPFTIASLAGNPVREPADLVGKRIGMATANTPVLQALCTLNGVDINAIEIVPTQYDPAPLVGGQVDCLLSWLTDLPVAMTIRGVDNVTMLMADFGYTVHSQTYICTEDALADNRAAIVALLRGEIRGWQSYRQDPATAAALTMQMFPDAGLDLETQELQASEQDKLMYSPLTDESGFAWFTEETVAANVETLALLGRTVSPDLWDRSVLEEIYADGVPI